MRGDWIVRPGHLVVVGSFGDVETHNHPAVQVSVGLGGELEVTDGDGAVHRCGAAVVASGTRHSMRSAGASTSLSVYYSPETSVAATLNACSRADGRAGVLVFVEDFTAAVGSAVSRGDLGAAADSVLDGVLARCRAPVDEAGVHAQLRAAIDIVARIVPDRAALCDVAGDVALSPDYLGRLFRTQTGSSFAATVRWRRLLSALAHIAGGSSVTDAAHLAGFADGAHAARTCRELTGAAPSVIIRALR